MVSLQQWSITWGILIMYFIEFGCSYLDGNASFRIPWGLQMVPAVLLSVGMLFFPESPRWLVKKGKDAQAASSLARLTSLSKDDPEVESELADIRAALKEEQDRGEGSYADCFRATHNKILLRTLTGIFIQAWQQLTGINFIFYCTFSPLCWRAVHSASANLLRRRHDVLPELRHLERLPDHHRHLHRQRVHDPPRNVGR